MTADSTLFSDNDLTEPDYSGQVVAESSIGSGSKEIDYQKTLTHTSGPVCVGCNSIPPNRADYMERRLFQRIDHSTESFKGLWQDRTGEKFLFTDLVDVVIINRGMKL